jgi:hypothetical protein
MSSQNVALRGGTYYWRKKITVAGAQITLALPLSTGSFKVARIIALRLDLTAETLRMAYGQSSGLSPNQLKKVFGDALRWQLKRILRPDCQPRASRRSHDGQFAPRRGLALSFQARPRGEMDARRI